MGWKKSTNPNARRNYVRKPLEDFETKTYSRIKKFVHYDPETGVFTRLRCDSSSKFLGPLVFGDWLERPAVYVDNTRVRAIVLAHFMMTRKHVKPGEWVSPIDGDHFNLKWSNLRKSNRATSAQASKLRSDNYSGYKGVYLMRSGRWLAKITSNKNVYSSNLLHTKDEAIAWRKAMEKKLNWPTSLKVVENI